MSVKVKEKGKGFTFRLWDQFSLEHNLRPVPHTTRIALLSSLERQTK